MSEQKSSIRTQLTLLLATTAVATVGTLSYFQYRSIQADLEGTESNLMALADATSMGIQEFLANSERVLERLAQDPDLRSLSAQRCPAYFADLRRIYIPTYTNLFTWTQDGEQICEVLGADEASPTLGSPPGLEEIKAAQGFNISPVHQGTSTGRWTTGLTYPLRDDEGRKVGNITLSVDLIRFQEILEGLNLSGDLVVSVVQRGSGTIVARSRGSEEFVGTSLVTAPDASSPNDPLTEERGASKSKTPEGEDFYWGFVRIPDTPWTVFAGRPLQAVNGPLLRRWIQSSVLALGTIILLLLLGRAFYARIANPLEELVKEVEEALPGESAPLTVHGPREVAQLAAKFNQAWEAWGRAEAERQRSMDRIRSLVENAVTGIYISTENGRFLEVNQAMVDLLGYESREELLGTPVSTLYPSEDERLEVLAAHGHKEFFRGIEVDWVRKDGGKVSVRLFGRRFISPEGEVSWEVFAEDTTKIRNLQQQYLQAQKMEALGRLAGSIAHDFNNLLTVVQGQAELILEDPTVGEDLKAQVREIAGAAERGGELNRQLLSFGRRGPRRDEKVSLNSILTGFEMVLRRAVGEEMTLEVSMDPDAGWILGDRGQMEQVIMNLVVNARDAMQRGGTLRIETQGTELDEEAVSAYPSAHPGPHVVLAVTDTGTGIDPELVPSIFEPFFTTKPETKGSGLGLATVYGIVTEFGGHIRVNSVPNEGTTFQLFFPLTDPPTESEEVPQPQSATPTGSGVILLAEDETSVRRLTTRILKRAGYQVLAAKDGREALEMARSFNGTIDILLTDVVMPELRGPELAKALTEEGRVKRAVLFSGYPDGMRDRSDSPWELLLKPFTARELLAAIKRALDVGS